MLRIGAREGVQAARMQFGLGQSPMLIVHRRSLRVDFSALPVALLHPAEQIDQLGDSGRIGLAEFLCQLLCSASAL
jgi:hypothetical protein